MLATSGELKDDSKSRVIEYGGAPHVVKELLAEAFRYSTKSIKVSIPEYDKELSNLFTHIKNTNSVYPGTIKIMNLNLLIKQLSPYLSGKISIDDIDESNKRLVNNNNSFTVSYDYLQHLILQGNQNLEEDLQHVSPIPFPFPEGLNYV